MKWYVTGDTHRDFSRFKEFSEKIGNQKCAVIILGDAGVNINKPTEDYWFKNSLQKKYPNITFYLVRGNHEERPTGVHDIHFYYDAEVDGNVWVEPAFPNIKYLADGGIYCINGLKTLVIGGAYSIDKYYRLERGLSWFASEQLTANEMANIKENVAGKDFEMVLSHTCPIDWEPTDLFLPYVSQQQVDKSMERFLQEIQTSISWNIWLFGHYHDDRLERPGVQMFYRDIESLDDIWNRWDNYWMTGQLDQWYLRKSPHFYMD